MERVYSARLLITLALLVLFLACDAGRGGQSAAAPRDGEAGSATTAARDDVTERPAESDLESLESGDDVRIYYQYIDERSRVVFVERLSDVPEAWRSRVGFVEMDSPPPLSPGDARRSREAKYGAPTVAVAAGPEVILYYADWCGYCHKAKRHLERLGVPFELRDVDVPSVREELIAKTGQKGIPVIEIDGRIMKGYSADGLDQMLAGRDA